MPVASLWMVRPTSGVQSKNAGFLKPLREENRPIPPNSLRFHCMGDSGLKNRDIDLPVVSPVTFSNEHKVSHMVLKQANLLESRLKSDEHHMKTLNEAYDRCREICEESSKTFYLGSSLLTPERRRAIWAIYAWCRRTDSLVDGPDTSDITLRDLDRWEERLEDIFRGQPHDDLDAALSDTISKFPIDIQPFRDMIEGMRMDLTKSRYKNFDELYLYCYYVSGTVGLMILPVVGIAPESLASTESVYNDMLTLWLANQLTNILRDVGEDARRGRVYLPQDELAGDGLSYANVFTGKVTDRWRKFMKKQIKRARELYHDAEKSATGVNSASRWPIWTTLLLSRQILDEIEANDYDNLTRCATVSKPRKFLILAIAYAKSIVPPPSSRN